MQTVASVPAGIWRLPVAWPGQHRLVVAALAVALIAGAMAWQWSWLVALGVAPLLVSAAPCALMCGLGLCMHRIRGRSCGALEAPAPPPQADREIGFPTDYTVTKQET